MVKEVEPVPRRTYTITNLDTHVKPGRTNPDMSTSSPSGRKEESSSPLGVQTNPDKQVRLQCVAKLP